MASMIVARAAARPVQAARSSSSSKPQPRQLAFRAPARALYFHSRQSIVAAAAETEEAEEVADQAEEDFGDDEPASTSFAEKLAKLQAVEGTPAEPAEFSLNFLWLDKNIAVAVDQVFGPGQRSPVTEYFFWPRKDAWEELKASLDARSWIGEREKVLLLNQCTEVINAWQAENKLSLEEARAKFPNCRFSGS